MGSQKQGSLVTLCFVLLCCVVNRSFGLAVVNDTVAKNSTLELVHLVFRHGPRTPVNTYPNDPYVKETFFPYGWGHLTNDAKNELFKMGTWLSKRYKQLLEPYYKNDLLHAQSTASPRTLMSMATVLAGMFPPRKTPMDWNIKYNWQPIPVYSDPIDTDILLRMTATCPRYDQAFAEVMQKPEVMAELAAHANLFRDLSRITGINMTSANDITSIYITLLAEEGYGLKLPDWTKDFFPGKMQFMAEQSYIYSAYTTEMKRMKGGHFLKKMFGEMQEKAKGQPKPLGRKAFLYCAHDWSITHILSALNVWKRQMPRFSAMAMFELHRNAESGAYHVEIYFKNNPTGELEKLQVPGCEFECPLEKLIKLSSDVLPNISYQKMCFADDL